MYENMKEYTKRNHVKNKNWGGKREKKKNTTTHSFRIVTKLCTDIKIHLIFEFQN